MKLAENAVVYGWAIMRRNLFAFLPGALAVALPLAANADYPADFPAGVPADAVWLEEPGDDGNSYNSLTTDASGFRWSNGAAITADDTDKVYFIPAGRIVWQQGAEHSYIPPEYEGRDTVRRQDAGRKEK